MRHRRFRGNRQHLHLAFTIVDILVEVSPSAPPDWTKIALVTTYVVWVVILVHGLIRRRRAATGAARVNAVDDPVIESPKA